MLTSTSIQSREDKVVALLKVTAAAADDNKGAPTEEESTEESRTRNIEEDSDSDDDSHENLEKYYYDSYSSSDYEEETQQSTKEEEEDDASITEADYGNEPKVKLFNELRKEITDEHLMIQMSMEHRLSRAQKLKLIPQLRKYLFSVTESQGFECDYFTRSVCGVTSYVPRQYVIDQRDKYPEAYSHYMYMANLALKDYNKKEATGFKLSDIKKVNVTQSMWDCYKITFTASSGLTKDTFRAHVWYSPLEQIFELGCCGCTIIPDSTVKNDDLLAEEPIAGCEKLDPVLVISNLKALRDDELWEKIKNYRPSAKKKEKLLTQVRNYFDSVVEKKGYKISTYPGHIPGVTDLKPREKITLIGNRYGECIDHLKFMAKLGLDYYLNVSGEPREKYWSLSMKNANVWKEESSRLHIYYLTFLCLAHPRPSGVMYYPRVYFQAKVFEKNGDIEVDSCTKVEG